MNTQTLPQRPDRRPMGPARAAASPPARPGGRPRKTDMREVVNAIFYLNREGCTWRALPHDFPPWKTVYNYFQRLAARRHLGPASSRACAAASARPPAATPTPRVAASTASRSRPTRRRADGNDGGKKVTGRKRHIVVDTLGLLLAVVVTAANVRRRRSAQEAVRADAGPAVPAAGGGAGGQRLRPVRRCRRGCTRYKHFVLELVRRPAKAVRLVLLPKRWVVERTFAWLGRYRIHSRDYERLPRSRVRPDRNQHDPTDAASARTNPNEDSVSVQAARKSRSLEAFFTDS